MNRDLFVRIVILSVEGNKLKVFSGKHLPSAKLSRNRTLEDTALSLFMDSAGLKTGSIFFEQLYTFSRKDSIEAVYYFLLPQERVNNWKDWTDCAVFEKKGNTAGDSGIIDYAVTRLQWKIEYTNVVYSLLPDEFTFSRLQSIYEAILGKPLDKRNFRKKILSLKILKGTGEKKKSGRARPAEMYRFCERRLRYVQVL